MAATIQSTFYKNLYAGKYTFPEGLYSTVITAVENRNEKEIRIHPQERPTQLERLKDKFGLIRDGDMENALVYLVQPLPQSLLYYVFSFSTINKEDEKKYIKSIIHRLFTKEEEKLHYYLSKVDTYEEFLKNLFFLINQYYRLPPIEWLIKT